MRYLSYTFYAAITWRSRYRLKNPLAFYRRPKWNADNRRQEEEPKPPSEAYKALLGILGDRQLRLDSYREVVKVREKDTRYDRQTKKLADHGSRIIPRESAAVCCVSDIPIAHLSYHAGRYGKVALGFHRDAHLQRDSIPRCELGHPADASGAATGIADAIAAIADIAELGKDHFKEFLAFVKTFDVHEFSTIYCEREWRSTTTFSFHVDDIAMVVLPNIGHESLFRRFVTEGAPAVGLPRTVPIVPWEDLIEH